ncbi:MAG: hypothetical protein ACLTKI_04575 [Lachnospiraceae bacterium]
MSEMRRKNSCQLVQCFRSGDHGIRAGVFAIVNGINGINYLTSSNLSVIINQASFL